MLENFTLSTFTERQSKIFKLRLNSDLQLELALVGSSTIPPACPGGSRPPGARESFSVVFLGPKEFQLPQSIYPFEHPEIGSFEMFIVPIDVTPEGFLYEAVFN
jgi:hypothetical protein